MKLTPSLRELIFERIGKIEQKIQLSKHVAAKEQDLKDFEELKQDLHRGEIERLKKALFNDEFIFEN